MGYDYDDAESAFWESTVSFHSGYGGAVGYAYFANEEEDEDEKMKTVDELRAEQTEALERVKELEKVIEQREKMGTDPFKNGAILKVEMRYPPSRTTYTYAVIKIAGRFWLTGKMQQRDGVLAELDGKRNGWSWENFIAWLAQGDASVWQAQNLEQIF